MNSLIREKLQKAGFSIIRKYSTTRGGKPVKVIYRVTEGGKMKMLECYDTKEQRDAAFDKMLESETLLAG